jgi:integrase
MLVYPRRRDTSGTLTENSMARRLRSAKLETRTARLKLPIRKKPYTARVAPGVRVAYRRNETAGSWSVIAADGKGGNWMKQFATADDYEEANGETVLDFWQAQERARIIARSNKDPDADSGKPISVGAALDRYEADLKARGGDAYNARRVRVHLSDTLANEAVALLGSPRKFRHWRDGLTKKGLAANTVNRTCAAFQAALEHAAKLDPRITNQSAWRMGLAALPDAEQSRNVIIPDDAVLRIVSAAYEESPQFGLLVECAAVTGARVSQLARLEVGDAQGDRHDPRLMMPSARKGKGRKRIERRPVPIPANLVTALKQASVGKSSEALLLTRPDGGPWRHSDHRHPFARAVTRAKLDPAVVTAYALRHSSIVRQLLANTPIRVVAVQHDTSVVMLERTYSKYIADYADALSRRALLDTTRPVSGNAVVPLKSRRTTITPLRKACANA